MAMVRPARRLFLKAVASAGLCLVASGWMRRPAEAAFRVGDVPSRISLKDLQGRSVVVPSDFRGRVAVIHFWASWCPTCRGEMKALELLYGTYGGAGVTPCSIGIGERRETAAAYLKNMSVSYPVLLDPDSSTRRPFGVAGIPTYFILDRAGAIRHRILGKADPKALDGIVRSLL